MTTELQNMLRKFAQSDVASARSNDVRVVGLRVPGPKGPTGGCVEITRMGRNQYRMVRSSYICDGLIRMFPNARLEDCVVPEEVLVEGSYQEVAEALWPLYSVEVK